MRAKIGLTVIATAIAASGCATTAFTTTWRNPETAPISLEGRKIVAIVCSADETTRRTGEDTVAAELTALGGLGLPAWTIIPTADVKSEDKARAALASAGATAVVMMEIVAQTREFTPSTARMRWRSAGPRPFWPHYRWAWDTAWSPPPPPRTNVWVETLVYTLDPDDLIWAGRSRTVNAADSAALFAEVASVAAREMQRAGLLRRSADRRAAS
jgi:hypothetical protein